MKKLMLHVGIRYLLSVIETAHRMVARRKEIAS